jgi:hypothetical protein
MLSFNLQLARLHSRWLLSPPTAALVPVEAARYRHLSALVLAQLGRPRRW